MSILVNKLATAVLIRAGKQYSCQIRDTDSETENLIQMLSLQAITQLKIRLTADNFEQYKEISSLNQKTVFFDIFIRKTAFFNNFIREFTFFDNLNVRKKKLSILNLIKNTQEFDLLCR